MNNKLVWKLIDRYKIFEKRGRERDIKNKNRKLKKINKIL